MAIKQGKSERLPTLPVSQLLLDKENPRLASSLVQEPTQEDLVRVLWTQMAVDEVALSIAANGYYEDEPLLIIPGKQPRAGTSREYIVIEGNRRLAAVLLLRDSSLRRRIKATDLPSINETDRKALDTLPVSLKPDRESVWAYIGFRHVNGTMPWDADSKAQYVAHVHEDYGVSLRDIANRIGDKHFFVERIYRGYKVLRQAEQQAGFDREDRIRKKFNFSHLYTAVRQPQYQKFLGLTDDRWRRPHPVPKSKLHELAELMTWLYGRRSTNTEPIVESQNPDLNRLREVIAKPAALSALRAEFSLEVAYEISVGDPRRFREALTAAKEQLLNAKGTVVTGYKGENDLLEMIGDIVRVAVSIEGEMASRQKQPSTAVKAR